MACAFDPRALAAALLATLMLAIATATPIEMNLGTWNIHHGCACSLQNASLFNNTLSNFAKFAGLYDLNMVGLIDVDLMSARGGNVDQAAALCKYMPGGCMGLQTFFTNDSQSSTGASGIAAISNTPLGAPVTQLFNRSCYSWSDSPDGHGILATPVTISNFTFYVFTVHAPGANGSSQYPRYCQAAQLIDFVSPLTHNMTDFHVIMGDFHSSPANEPFYNYMTYFYVDAYVASAIHESPTPNGSTWSTCQQFNGGQRYDSVWLPQQWASRIEWLAYVTPATGTCSDHVPVIAQFVVRV